MGTVRIAHDGAWLAEYLRSPDRLVPAVVVSVHSQMPEGRIDVDAMAREVDGLAEVFQIENGPQTWALKDALPPGRSVYGDAVRAYSVTLDWLDDMYRSPLHLSDCRAKAQEAVVRVAEDVLTMAPAHWEPALGAGAAARPPRIEATGVVTGFAAEGMRALVAFGDGRRATIAPEDALPGIRLDWVLSVGQQVQGLLDPAEGAFDISGLRQTPSLAACYSHGDQVLGLVVDVKPAKAKLRLYPGSDWTLGHEAVTSNPLDTMDMLLSEGEVIVARFTRECGAVRLSVIDVDDDQPVVPPPALIAGGKPWLDLDRTSSAVRPAEAAAPAETIAMTGGRGGAALRSVQRALDAERAQTAALRRQLDADAPREDGGEPGDAVHLAEARTELTAVSARLDEAEYALQQSVDEVGRVRDELSRCKAGASRQRKAARAREQQLHSQDVRGAFADPEDWVRHELYEAWVRVIPAGEKARWPLPSASTYAVGPDFVASLQHERVRARLGKAFDMCIRAIIHDQTLTAPLEVHARRAGTGPEDPQVVREADGATAWRAAEKRTPAAPRLHFWRLPDGRIELDTVQPHDQGI